ncbi:hypothetical protein SEA_OHMYWARD_80 [Gordonia phage OhMyWard]|uniref:Uncharacterized protein n=1 Tax=Gordonia phage OhMyWard TaxID=2652414 RepID=A0A5P8D939_9CAUD|nr:hypothetical protein HWC72_gp80 [Gordonia phage OhMyWard]QFP94962.1 hypothetical protein SEA_OHMYWARD_80 [Gordonia phage OhMyWard]
MVEQKIDIAINDNNMRRVIDWFVVDEKGFRLLAKKMFGATDEEVDRMLRVLDSAGLDTMISKDKDCILFATMYK